MGLHQLDAHFFFLQVSAYCLADDIIDDVKYWFETALNLFLKTLTIVSSWAFLMGSARIALVVQSYKITVFIW